MNGIPPIPDPYAPIDPNNPMEFSNHIGMHAAIMQGMQEGGRRPVKQDWLQRHPVLVWFIGMTIIVAGLVLLSVLVPLQ